MCSSCIICIPLQQLGERDAMIRVCVLSSEIRVQPLLASFDLFPLVDVTIAIVIHTHGLVDFSCRDEAILVGVHIIEKACDGGDIILCQLAPRI